ncbi:MAG: S8 family serine peptidase, partial [Gemmataceae bacterium]|nr:S8 family serine peptidase [Gemmataceae bacterium]
ESFFAGDSRFSSHRPLAGTPDQFYATVAAGNGSAAIALAEDLSHDARLIWASPALAIESVRYTNDPNFANQWHLNNTGQSGGVVDADVDAPEAWAITTGSPNIVVAVLDDAVQWTHPDLVGNVWTNPGEIAGNSLDDDGNGWADDVTGWDFWDNDNNPEPNAGSTDNHGTACAGIPLAVGDNNLGVAGVAYTAKLLPIRSNIVPDLCPPDVPSAVYYAAGRTANGLGTWRGADVVSCSWGFLAPYQPLDDALIWASNNGRGGKGLPTFIATGNDSASTVGYPANLAGTNPGIIAVGATTRNDLRASYSNYGADQDFAAPGSSISTTDRTGSAGYNSTDYTSSFSGTSAATPLAAGIGALVLSRNPNLTAAQLRGQMRNTTDLIGNSVYGDNGRSTPYGYGRLNAFTAVFGVGKAVAQVTVDRTVVESGTGSASFTATTAVPESRTFRIRNQGTLDLSLGGITITGQGFTAGGFTDSVLSVGEAANFTVTFAPNYGGTFNATLSFATNDLTRPTYSIALSGTATDVSPPRVASVRVNDGSAQRSRVTSVTVTFNEPVTLPVNPASAFTLVGPTGSVAMTGSASTTNGATAVTLSFSGTNTEFSSLKDGLYTLTAIAGQITDGAGFKLDGNGDGTAGDNATSTLHRLYGDANGDRSVQPDDFLAFRLAFLGASTAFDFDGANNVDPADFLQFRLRFLTAV